MTLHLTLCGSSSRLNDVVFVIGRRSARASREIRSLYPAITENHLRYLEKWGLLRTTPCRAIGASTRSPICRRSSSVAVELERGTPLQRDPARAGGRAPGQLQLDFQDATRATRRAPRSSRSTPHRAGADVGSRRRCPSAAASMQFPFADPQAALAAKYFVEGSRLDDGDERNMEEAAAAYRKALIIDPDLVPAIVNLANIHYARDELIEAQALYERAIGLDPDCFEAHFNLGNILHDLGRFDARWSATATPWRSTRLPRRALLPGGHAGEDRPLTRGEAALEGLPGARAGRRVGGAGEGILVSSVN